MAIGPRDISQGDTGDVAADWEAGGAKGRSLWGDAWLRLRANRAAMASVVILTLIALACVAGPWLSPHGYNQVYRDYVKVPASLSLYPKASAVGPALVKALRRARVEIDSWEVVDDGLRLVLTADKPIDPRITRYLDRANLFVEARVVEESADGKRIVLEAEIDRKRFLFGTDSNGRDLLTRTLVAGRISLMIGLLATFVALTIGNFHKIVSPGSIGKTAQLRSPIFPLTRKIQLFRPPPRFFKSSICVSSVVSPRPRLAKSIPRGCSSAHCMASSTFIDFFQGIKGNRFCAPSA